MWRKLETSEMFRYLSEGLENVVFWLGRSRYFREYSGGSEALRKFKTYPEGPKNFRHLWRALSKRPYTYM